MKLLDGKGKIFGVINIIDLIVLVLVAALVLGGAYRLYRPGGDGAADPEGDAVLIKGRVFEVSDYTVNVIKKGDRLMDPTSRSYFGEIVDLEVAPHRRLVEREDGRVVMSEVPERYDVTLYIAGTARISRDAIRMATHEVRVGSRIVLAGRDYMVQTTILSVEIQDQ